MALPSISDATSIRSLDDFKDLFNTIKCQIDDIPVDVLSSSTATHDFTITERPVESGYNLNDARIALPVTLSLECIFTNAIENLTPSGVIKSLISTGGVNFDSWKKKRDHLLKLKDKNKLISIKTPDKVYKNMMITNISMVRNNTADAFFFTVDFKEITIKQTEVISVNQDDMPENVKAEQDKPTEKRKAPNKGGGKKTPKGKVTPGTPVRVG